MSEFSDLKKLREVLDSLPPPMVMVGRCSSCRWFENYEQTGRGPCLYPGPEEHQVGYVTASYGCVYWSRKP